LGHGLKVYTPAGLVNGNICKGIDIGMFVEWHLVIEKAAGSLDLDDIDFLVVENVGNLVCPT